MYRQRNSRKKIMRSLKEEKEKGKEKMRREIK
jgi:hypothetical protein